MRQSCHYRIPDTRLPFVNGEVAEVDFQERPHLVSGTWMAGRGRLYFWDPVTSKSEMRELPPGVPGAYMIKTGADRKLYLGCGNGDLCRYDPATDSFETLATGVMHSITWGGCVTDRYVVWAASPGEAAIYDLKDAKLLKKFSSLDTEKPAAQYGHTVIAAPDGKVVAFVNVPQTRTILIDPPTGSTEVHTPREMQGAAWTTQAAFINPNTIVALVKTEKPTTLLLEYPSLKVVAAIPAPETPMPTNQRACVIDGKFYAQFGATGSLYRFDGGTKSWQCVARDWLTDAASVLGIWAGRTVVALKMDGEIAYFDTHTGKTSTGQIEAWGPLEAHALCVVPEANLIVGAPFINRRFWTIDMKTGQGQDRGRAQPGSGQITHIAWDSESRKALLSSYTLAALTEYDPARGGEWPENPRLVNSAKPEGQLRPKALVFDGRYAWMATSPDYGTLGGALTRFDPVTNEKRVWRNIVPNQTINNIILDKTRNRLYLSSDIHADMNSCPPTEKTAQMVVFDTQSLEIVKRQEICLGEPTLLALCLLPNNGVVVMTDTKVYCWRPESGATQNIGEVPGLLQMAVDEQGTAWAVARGGIGRFTIKDGQGRVEVLIPEPQKVSKLQCAGGMLYYGVGSEVRGVPTDSLK